MNYNYARKVRALLGLCVGISGVNLALSQTPASDDTESDVVELERFEVTGTHISGIDAATLNPVASI
ncbi:MAG TPA: hypothetical protein VL069_16050, partial [Opitutus sp.]|nr:hypothetical protein [Opitutus sp.]